MVAQAGPTINVGNLIARIIFRGDTTALDNAQRRIDAFRTNLNSISVSTGIAGGAITGFTALNVREFARSETAYAKLRGQAGLLDGEIADLRPEVKRIAQEFGFTEAAGAEALFTITSAGLRGAAAIDTLRVAAMGSASEMGEVQDIARLVIPVLSAYGAENQSAALTGDQLAASVRLGNFEAARLARALPILISVAAEAGISFGDLAASMATASRVQPRLLENATGLRQLIFALISPTAQAQKQLRETGLSVTFFADSLRERGLLPTLQSLVEVVGDDNVALRELLGSVEAVTVLQNILSAGMEEATRIFDEVNNASGDLATTYESFDSTAALDVRRVFAQIRDTMAELGRIALPLVREGIERLRPILESVTAQLQDENSALSRLVELLTVLGPILIGISIAARALSLVLGLVTVATELWAAAQRLLNTALFANPIGLIVAGVAALAGLLYVVVNYWEEIWSFVTGIAGVIGQIGGILFGGRTVESDNNLPRFQSGGIVPGAIGQPLLAVVHGGELIVPAPIVTGSQSASAVAARSSQVSVVNNIGDINVSLTQPVDDPEYVASVVNRSVATAFERESRKIADFVSDRIST